MNKKRSVSIILIILSIILIGIGGYFTLIKNLTPPTTTNQISPKSVPTKETFPTTTPTLEKVISYDLKFDFYYIDIEDLIFGLSKDGKYGYIASQNIKDNKYYIQINNQTYGPYDKVYNFQFSNDSSKYGWKFGKDCEYEVCKQYYIQINNQTYGPYDYVYNLESSDDSIKYVKFSNDGSKYGWIFKKDNKYYIQINNQTYGSYDYVYNLESSDDSIKYVKFSNDGSKYGWIFKKDNKYYIQINNQTYGPYYYVYNLESSDDSVKYVKFSNDGSKYGWWFGKDCKYGEGCKQHYIQINNQTYGPYYYVYYFSFSNDGSKYGWRFVKDYKSYIQINNQTYGPYDYVYYGLRFSNDGSKYGWLFGKDCGYYGKGIKSYECKQYYIQINNQTYGPYGRLSNFTFTNDNKAYIIYIKDNKMTIEQID
jgi:hypothetical protein